MKSRVRMGLPCTFSIILFASIVLGSSLLATPPAAPNNLSRSNYVESPRLITLAWQDNSNTETSFFVEWTQNGGATWATFGQVGANITSCSASLPSDQTLYLFRVYASDGTESSDFSNIVSVEGTDLAVTDTDGDGIYDGYEVTHGMNPYVEDSYEDSDGDRYPNIIEYAKGTNPNEATSMPAADFVVDPVGPAQGNVYTTIQAALDAVSADFQIVVIKKGLFQGTGNTNLVLPSSHPVLLMSESGARETILDGGGVARGLTLSTSSVIDGLTIRNTVATYGAAVYVSGGSPLFVNSVFVDNQAQESGGAVYQEAGNSLLVHMTLSNNQATTGGSGLSVESGTLSADKSILWDAGSVSEIEVAVGATCEVTESIVRGGYSGSGNSSNDPLLRADGHLMAGSLAIDSGGTLQTALLDMDGEVRPSGSTTDVGADEWVDSDTNSLPDWWEVMQFGQLGNLSASDADGDGLSNLQEYQGGSDPLNYYSQGAVMITPTINIVGGNNQIGVANANLPIPLAVRVTNASTGLPLPNAPVTYSAEFGTLSDTSAQTDASGIASVVYHTPSSATLSTISAITGIGSNLASTNFTVGTVVPPQSGLALWFKSDGEVTKTEDGTRVISWTDSATGVTTSQATAAARPIFISSDQGGKPAIQLTGSEWLSSSSQVSLNSDWTIITLGSSSAALNDPSNNRYLLSIGAGAGTIRALGIYENRTLISLGQAYRQGVGSLDVGETNITSVKYVKSTTAVDIYLRGQLNSSSTVAMSNTASGVVVGAYSNGGYRWKGKVQEIMVYNRALSPGELHEAHLYLKLRYYIADSDTDGLTDAWENQHFGNLDPMPLDDPDGDGLSNIAESLRGTDPNVADTDGDGADDAMEVAAGSSPLIADSDSDGIPDGYEITNGLNALSDDSQLDKDGDGIPNQWEYVNGSQAWNSANMNPNWVVDPAHGGDSTTDNVVSTIAEAIAAAPVDNGIVITSYKSILVKNGQYTESVTIPTNKRLALVGERGGKVILVGSSLTSTVLSFGAKSAVDGFVISRAASAIQAGTVTGSGVYVNGSSAHGVGRISNCLIYGHAKGMEFGDNPTGSASVEYCSIFRNKTAGLYAPYRDRISTVKNCIIWNPLAGASNQFGSPNGYVPNLAGNIVYSGQFGGINSDPKLSAEGLLCSGSGAKDIATGGAAIYGDIHGETRPNGATGDMGADEWVDSDNDGLNDQWEMICFGSLLQDGVGDFDGDGLNNGTEGLTWTNPCLSDTDGDGASDAVEIAAGTSPLLMDSDLDGMSDGYEFTNGLNPLADDALLDKDGDRIPNLWEYCKGAAAGDKYTVPSWDFVVDPAHASDSGTDNIVGTVGAAIAAAPALGANGVGYSTIYVKAGDYPEAIDLLSNKAIALIAEVGTTPVRLVGSGSSGYSVLNFSGKAVVDGFKITRPEAVILAGTSLGPGVGVNTGTLKSRLANCLITGSTWNYTGGLYVVGGNILVENCTVFGNTTTGSVGSGMFLTGSPKIEIKSSIFWDSQSSGAAEVYKASSATLTIINSIVRGAQYGGLNVEPRLRKDGKLLGDSPAINAGDPTSTLKTDIEGEERPGGGIVDMGVDEYVDVDTDGLSDLWEVRYFGNLNEVANGDTDGDGLLNSFEYLFSLNPALGDTDGNARDDFYDALSALATLHYPEDWLADADSDGLLNGWEDYFGTDRNNPDTNFDGISDSVSVSIGIDALDLDHDGDGCSNMVEISAGTNLFYTDTDRDGVDDLADAYPLDPLRSTALSSDPQDTIAPEIALTEPDFAILLP